MYLAGFILTLILIASIKSTTASDTPAEDINDTNDKTNNNFEPSVNDIAETLIFMLLSANNGSVTNRTKELREKLQKLDSYVVDKESYFQLIINNTKQTDLNATNFFMALNDKDNTALLGNNTNKSLYLKIKEKMNRADVLTILAERSKGNLMKSARRSMDTSAKMPKKLRDKELNEVIDHMLAETPTDDHTFGEEDKYNMVWDPQVELEERQSKASGRRIFKGERTNIRYYPFVVSVHVMGRFWCGGVLYWHDLVITSASCVQLMHNNRFFRENPKVLAVRVGSNHSRISGELVEAMEVYFHPSYNPRTLRNNLALIRLRRHIRFDYHRVPKIIKISTSPDALPFTGEVLVLGWGVTKSTQRLAYEPIFLQRKLLPVYPNNFCKEVYGDKFITTSMFCAGTFTTGEGACDHDAGGPAVLDGKLVGIISFGPTVCGYPNTPTVFTHIGSYVDWIETVNETIPSYYRGKQRTTTTTEFPWAAYFNTGTKSSTKNVKLVAAEVEVVEVETSVTEETSTATTEETPTEIPPPSPPAFRAKTNDSDGESTELAQDLADISGQE